ncbi:MAG: hypothetical protein R3A52_22960 [Polyangiales bacterium]
MLRHPLVDAYLERLADYEALGRAMHARVEAALQRAGVSAHAVSYRVKSPESLAGKLARPDKTYRRLDDITDLVGVRVITFFDDAVEAVARVIEAELHVDLDRSVDKRLHHDPSLFGYRSLHYVCHAPDDAARALGPVAFEVQIRTILQHAWAEIEHDLGYKTADEVPLPVRRRFSRLAGLLEIADQEFVELRRFMEGYARDLRRDSVDDVYGLDAVSLRSLLEREEVSRLDRALSDALGLPVSEAAYFPEYVLRALRAASVDRPSRVLTAAEEFAPRLPEFTARYFQFTSEAFGFGHERLVRVERGYAAALMAHWRALGDADLAMQRATRMESFYQRLDYPDDEAEARRVARVFARVFNGW